TRYNADAVVVSAGSWSAEIDGLPRELRNCVRPIKGEMISLAPPRSGRQLSRVVRGSRVYLVPRGDAVVAGATVADVGFDPSLANDVAFELFDAARELIPAFAEWAITDHWCGFRPTTPDELPSLGPTSLEGLYAATGQFRNGILFAPAMAQILKQVVLQRKAA